MEAAAAMASKESLSVEKSARNRRLIRKIQRLEFSSVFSAAEYFRLPCMDSAFCLSWNSTRRKIFKLNALFFISLRVASILTYLSCLKAI